MAARKWYALQVATGTESECALLLRGARMEAFAPARVVPELRGGIWRRRERTMLPGYVFLRSLMDVTDYYRVYRIPKAIRLLPGGGRVEPIPEDQMRWILELSNGGAPWEISTGVAADGRLQILSGPLAGREDKILWWDKRRRRARIAVEILNCRKEIEVGLVEATHEARG